VIHSGLYYPPGSLKAATCVRGQELVYAWASTHGVAHARTGKLVVARDELEVEALAELHKNAIGVRGERAACGSTHTEVDEARAGVADDARGAAVRAHGDRRRGWADEVAARRRGAATGRPSCCRAALTEVHATTAGLRLATTRGELEVSGAGQRGGARGRPGGDAGRGCIDAPQIYPCRGDYFRLHAPGRYTQLVYPVRRRGSP
jgi:hypothetical protein